MPIDPISYFRKLSDLLCHVEATRNGGEALDLREAVSAAISLIVRPGQKMMVIGNGGSAAIAAHIHNDLCNSVGVQAMVFNEPSQLTAISNDHGYEAVFERPLQLWANPGDLLWSISSSGKSENIVRAARFARERGCSVLTFSGFHPNNPLRQLGDLNFYVSSQSYGEVEVSHMALGHYLTDCAMLIQKKTEKAKA